LTGRRADAVNIVERARNRNMPHGHLELIDKLADEIERLVEENQTLRNNIAQDQQLLFHYERLLMEKEN